MVNVRGPILRIRDGVATDLPFLEQMLVQAFFWSPDLPRRPLEQLRREPEFAKLLADWGRSGDRAVVAMEDGARVGAAWFRLWTPERHSYGFVDARTPELGLAVAAAHRRRGLGRGLLRALVAAARSQGHPALSLSVDPANPARRLYEAEGFRKSGESGTSWTLLLPLAVQWSLGAEDSR